MRCLMCGKDKLQGSLLDMVMFDDPLCVDCRSEWKKKRNRFYLEGVLVESSYLYNDAFSSCLRQYKECNDEALYNTFLFEERRRLKMKYHNASLLLMPSSKKKTEERGFSHLQKMFSCLGIEMIDVFYKSEDIEQKQLTSIEREAMKDRIHLKEDIVLPNNVVLVDDTITTGATLSGAYHCIKGKCKKVRIYTVSYNRSWL